MGLSSKWFSGVSGKEEKDKREKFVRAHAELLDLLTSILQREHDEKLKELQSRKLYDHAAWAYEQADLAGCMRTLRELLEMTALTKD